MKKVLAFLLVAMTTFVAQAAVVINNASGWLETAYVEWAPSADYSDFQVYVRPVGGSYQALDRELLRNYGTYYRADALGLAAGQYQLKVVPILSNAEVEADAAETEQLTVAAHNRVGFAHTGAYATTGVGAYNNDGTLKTGAKVFYIYGNTAKTISTSVKTSSKGSETITGMQAIITAYQKGYDTTPLCFRVIGHLLLSNLDGIDSSGEGLQIKGRNADSELNITIEGVGNDAFIQGFGFLLRNAKSVELRNFGVATGIDDDISLDTDNDHIWIHNIDAFYGPNKGGDQAKGDGAIDVKGDSKHVTISYCHFWDTGKSSMCGMTSESGPNYITYHHNWFDHSDSRHPRIRTMSVHLYNNYFDGNAKYCVGSTMGSSVFVEGNYFRNCSKPMLVSKQGTDIHNGVGTSDETKGTFSGEQGGTIKAYENTFTGSKTLVYYSATNNQHFDAYLASTRSEQVPSTVTSLLGNNTYDNFDTNSSVMYAVTPEPSANVPATVTGDLGAGRCQHGDFSFAFSTSDDSDYSVNSALRSAIDNYQTTLVGLISAPAAPQDTTPVTPVVPGDTTIVNPGDTTVTPVVPTTSDYLCTFTASGATNSFYTVSGNVTNKETATYNGQTYNYSLKMESSTNVSFTTTEELNFTLVLGGSKKNLKVDGTKKEAASTGVLTFTLAAGSHSFTKADVSNLFYINAVPTTPAATDLDNVETTKTIKLIENGQVIIIRDGVRYDAIGRKIR